MLELNEIVCGYNEKIINEVIKDINDNHLQKKYNIYIFEDWIFFDEQAINKVKKLLFELTLKGISICFEEEHYYYVLKIKHCFNLRQCYIYEILSIELINKITKIIKNNLQYELDYKAKRKYIYCLDEGSAYQYLLYLKSKYDYYFSVTTWGL